jgi:predicted small secreted protein
MKRMIPLAATLLVAAFLMSGCATWHGLKTDTKRAWHVITE